MSAAARFLSAVCALNLLLGSTSFALADGSALENRVRAAFLFNFARFTEWNQVQLPQQMGFCIAGAPDLLQAMRTTIKGKQIRQRSLLAFDAELIDVAKQCDVLYLGPDKLALISQAAPRTLLVGEGLDFASGPGMVGFLLRDDRLRFAINPAQVEAGGLSMSAQLLNLAEIVTPAGATP